ncbi:MAG: Protein of unknown function (DUF1501) [Burkholderiaceae bacterium]|jgi:uncharacterized protein (DUF1501 family)|nr:MAG: Protein of unknown function (DUF1501) [Burkholderiaceae bacterium]
MHFLQTDRLSRRAFLRRSSRLALAGTAMPFALNLAAIGEAAAFDATDYKALVCIFLYGGNDYGNTVVTYDDVSYDAYSKIRGGGANRAAGGIALAQADLKNTLLTPTAALAGGRQYALHPQMTGLAGLFNSGQAAVQLNVGPLIAPLTRDQYNSSNRTTYPRPANLFSHNDQQSTWQSSSPEGSTIGWGGHIGDLALSSNSTSLFTCISVAGNAVFLSGDRALQYQIGTDAAVKINAVNGSVYGSNAVRDALRNITQATSSHRLENEYNAITRRSIDSEGKMTAALNLYPASAQAFSSFTGTDNLSAQLRMVARIIAGRNDLGSKRQVFFVSLGGFDTHDGLLAQHTRLLGNLSMAMTSFYNATKALGVDKQVTAFTASDFGRTLSSNGDGTDHGWGSHHLMVGGAVNGAAFYGAAPPVSVTNTSAPEDQWHVGQGRLLPSTAVDQYAATLASWFGVADSELAGILPNLRNFGGVGYPRNLGFMA